jgi:hypothetical protein
MPIKFTNKNPQYQFPVYDSAVQILKAKFPDVLTRNDFSVEADFLGGAMGTTAMKDNKIQVDPSGQNFTTDNVVEMVNTILHEINHAENNTKEAKDTYYGNFGHVEQGREFAPGRIGDYDYSKESGLRGKQEAAQKLGAKLKLPSASGDYISESELLANLQAGYQMNQRQIPAGRTQVAVDELLKDPATLDWVKRNNYPQTQSLKESPTDIGANISSGVKNVVKSTADYLSSILPSFLSGNTYQSYQPPN